VPGLWTPDYAAFHFAHVTETISSGADSATLAGSVSTSSESTSSESTSSESTSSESTPPLGQSDDTSFGFGGLGALAIGRLMSGSMSGCAGRVLGAQESPKRFRGNEICKRGWATSSQSEAGGWKGAPLPAGPSPRARQPSRRAQPNEQSRAARKRRSSARPLVVAS
jgi:hypothetical protein